MYIYLILKGWRQGHFNKGTNIETSQYNGCLECVINFSQGRRHSSEIATAVVVGKGDTEANNTDVSRDGDNAILSSAAGTTAVMGASWLKIDGNINTINYGMIDKGFLLDCVVSTEIKYDGISHFC